MLIGEQFESVRLPDGPHVILPVAVKVPGLIPVLRTFLLLCTLGYVATRTTV